MKDIDYIGTGNLFHQLTDEELEHFRRQFKKVPFKAGEYVFKENDMGNTLYIVAKGVVSITRRIMVDVEKNIFIANEGTVFGEFNFMDAGERSASALNWIPAGFWKEESFNWKKVKPAMKLFF